MMRVFVVARIGQAEILQKITAIGPRRSYSRGIGLQGQCHQLIIKRKILFLPFAFLWPFEFHFRLGAVDPVGIHP